MMRLAIIATPAALPDLRPAPGALDGDALRSRLLLPDAGYHVVDLDPAIDVAEQLELLFEQTSLEPGTPALFYASSRVVASDDGELFLCLDPKNPETGDSVRDIATVIRDRVPGPVAFVIECRHAVDEGDPFRSATIVATAKDSLRGVIAGSGGVQVLVSARPLSDHTEERPSPLTRALIEALDEADPAKGLSLAGFFAQVRESDALVGVVPCFAHVNASAPFILLAGTDEPAPDDRAAPRVDETPAMPDAELDAPASSGRTRARRVLGTVSSVPARAPSAPPPAPSAPARAPSVPASAPSVPAPATYADHVAEGDALAAAKDHEGALGAYKRALGLLGPAAKEERADVHVRIGQVKQQQEKRREAIASFEKALSISSGHTTALLALLELNVAEGDLRAVQVAEDRVLATVSDPEARFGRLVEFGARWQDQAGDPARARAAFERAADLCPDDAGVLARLRGLYEQAGAIEEAIAVRRRLAAIAVDNRARAEQYFELGRYLLDGLKREEPALALFDQALASDPSMLEPLAVIARFFAERQEWSELERAYRTMLERAPRIPDAAVRSQVTWELFRLLGTLFRDHLEDPALALDAFEDAVAEKPRELQSRLTAAELARSVGAFDRAVVHLQAAAALDPGRLGTFHQLFELFQKLGRPDEAYSVACVTMSGRKAEARERFFHEEHKPDGVPKFAHAMREAGWDLLRTQERDLNLEAVLGTIAPAAIAARLSQLTDEGRLPTLDPAARQDPTKTTISIVRSFVWASHYLGVPPPAIYLHDDATVGLATIIAEEPTAFAGGRVLRGRSLPELAFLAGRHLAYHVGGHRLMLYYSSIEELSSCFLAAVKIALPDLPLPAQTASAVDDLVRRIEPLLDDTTHRLLVASVAGFEAARVRADIAGWVGAVERCATRAGFLLAGDLEVVATVLRSDPVGLISADEKIADLVGFVVSDEHHALREELGVAIQP